VGCPMGPLGDSISPLHVFQLLLRRWWVLIVLGTCGALAGLAFSATHPPVYESKAVLGVSIDYGISQPLELVVEDRAVNRVVGLVVSDAVLAMALAEVPESIRLERGWRTPADLRPALRLDQRLAQWELVGSDRDPAIAQSLAAAWAAASVKALDEARVHAWRAAGLVGLPPMDVDCALRESSAGTGQPAQWQCRVTRVSASAEALQGQLQTELDASRGLLPNITYELLQMPVMPEEPVIWGRESLVLAGASIGFLIGLVVALAWPGREPRPA